MKKQAFTLVELIVVITILAILGTVAFISLQGYTREARDSKRLSDINNIQKKIGIEIVKGTSLSSLINLVKTNSGLTINSASGTSIQGTANFQALKEDGDKFKDPITKGDYVLSYSVGGTGTGAYKFTQVSTINEENNQSVVKGNYYQMQSGDSISIIKNDNNSFVINEGSNLPYEPVAGGGDGGGPVYSCDDTTKPADNGHITYVGTPIAVNQAYIQDESNCGYSCNDGYTGNGCSIAPINSCNDLKLAGNNTSGTYTIDPEYNGTGFQVYCDMTTDGGGWTIIFNSLAGQFFPTIIDNNLTLSKNAIMEQSKIQLIASKSQSVYVKDLTLNEFIKSSNNNVITNLINGKSLHYNFNISDWTATNLSRLNSGCGDNVSFFNYPNFFQRCGNGAGVHIYTNPGSTTHGFNNSYNNLWIGIK